MADVTWLDYVTGAVAVAAFFRPDVEQFIARRQADCIITPMREFDLSITPFGAQMGFIGSLTAIGGNVVVDDVTAELVRQDDDTAHNFEWIVFRPTSLAEDPKVLAEASVVAGPVALQEDEPQRVNILLRDRRFQQEMERAHRDLANAWTAFLQGYVQQAANRLDAGAGAIDTSSIFAQWSSNNPLVAGAIAASRQAFYYRPGAYVASFRFGVTHPRKTEKLLRRSFVISKEEADLLLENLPTLLIAYMGNIPPAQPWVHRWFTGA